MHAPRGGLRSHDATRHHELPACRLPARRPTPEEAADAWTEPTAAEGLARVQQRYGFRGQPLAGLVIAAGGIAVFDARHFGGLRFIWHDQIRAVIEAAGGTFRDSSISAATHIYLTDAQGGIAASARAAIDKQNRLTVVRQGGVLRVMAFDVFCREFGLEDAFREGDGRIVPAAAPPAVQQPQHEGDDYIDGILEEEEEEEEDVEAEAEEVEARAHAQAETATAERAAAAATAAAAAEESKASELKAVGGEVGGGGVAPAAATESKVAAAADEVAVGDAAAASRNAAAAAAAVGSKVSSSSDGGGGGGEPASAAVGGKRSRGGAAAKIPADAATAKRNR